MKIMFYILVFSLVLPLTLSAGLTEDELKPYEKVLPKKMTPKEISEWPLEATYKDDSFKLDANTYIVRLNSKDKKKLDRKKEVRLQIAGEVVVSEPGKKPKRSYRGSVEVYVISTGEAPKVVGKKRVKLSRFCPS